MTLSTDQLRVFYDRFGSKQDSQRFYEDAALRDLVAHADFGRAARVVEFGCGTGRFAEMILDRHLPPDGVYEGLDLSSTMVSLSRRRLERFGPRARVRQTDGSIRLDVPSHSVDRVVSAYVLDLLPEDSIRAFLSEAARILRPGGRVCLLTLTPGTTAPSRVLIASWRLLYRAKPRLVGGCRPIEASSYLPAEAWRVLHRNVVVRRGIPSEVIVAEPRTARPLVA